MSSVFFLADRQP